MYEAEIGEAASLLGGVFPARCFPADAAALLISTFSSLRDPAWPAGAPWSWSGRASSTFTPQLPSVSECISPCISHSRLTPPLHTTPPGGLYRHLSDENLKIKKPFWHRGSRVCPGLIRQIAVDHGPLAAVFMLRVKC